MSSKPNHRRGHGRIQNTGPTYENRRPGGGCNSTHVARSRSKWKKKNARSLRRTGTVQKPWGDRMDLPPIEVEEEEDDPDVHQCGPGVHER